MVAPMFSKAAKAVAQPRTVEAFEGMMRDLVKESKNYKSPFVAKQKEIIIHNPSKNPFAPLYRPDREILYTMDKYHQFEPPKNLNTQKNEKVLLVAAGSPPPPPPGGDDFNNNNLKKVLACDNKLKFDDKAWMKNIYKK